MSDFTLEDSRRNSRAADFCLFCNSTIAPLQKLEGYANYVCADGYGCRGDYIPTKRQTATSLMMLASVAAVVSIPCMVALLIWWLYL